jgi:hypothetical protein
VKLGLLRILQLLLPPALVWSVMYMYFCANRAVVSRSVDELPRELIVSLAEGRVMLALNTIS